MERLRFGREHAWTQRHMSEYLDGDLDQEARQRAEHHTRDCPDCEELLISLKTIVRALGGIGEERNSGVAASVLAAVHERLEAKADDDAKP
jgi:anti-sigma factor RsiW